MVVVVVGSKKGVQDAMDDAARAAWLLDVIVRYSWSLTTTAGATSAVTYVRRTVHSGFGSNKVSGVDTFSLELYAEVGAFGHFSRFCSLDLLHHAT